MVFALINAMHVPLKKPSINSQDFYDYKERFSLNVQAVCDSQGWFIDTESKWPVSVHDVELFANSTVCKKLQSRKTNQSSLILVPGYDILPSYINRNPAYPITSYFMKEH